MTHKRLLFLFLLLLALLPGQAQFVGPLAPKPVFKSSWGFTFGIGAYHPMSYNFNTKLATGLFMVDMKRQFTPTLALGIEANLLLANQNLLLSRSTRGQIYLYGSANLLNLFVTPPIEPRRVEVDGVYAMGWGHNFKEEAANRDLGASYLVSKLGLNVSWYLNQERSWALNVRPALFYDLRTEKENAQIEYNINRASMMVTVGFTYRWTGLKKQRRRTYLHGVDDDDDEEDVVVNDTVRTMYIFPRLASRGRRSRSRTLPTPSVAVNPVQRGDLRPTTRVVAGNELPGEYMVDSAGHIMPHSEEHVVPLPRRTPRAQVSADSLRPKTVVTYGPEHEIGAPLEPVDDAVMMIPLSPRTLPTEKVKKEATTPTVPRTETVAERSASEVKVAVNGRPKTDSSLGKHSPVQTPDHKPEPRVHDRRPVRQQHASPMHLSPTTEQGEKNTPLHRVVTVGPDRKVEKAGGDGVAERAKSEQVSERRQVRMTTETQPQDTVRRASDVSLQGSVENTDVKPSQYVVIDTPAPVGEVPELNLNVPPASGGGGEKRVSRQSSRKASREEFDIYFASGSAAVVGTPMGEVARLVAYLRKNPSAEVSLSGYVSGGENRVLARRRAEAVRTILVSRFGIAARRVKMASFGIAYFSSVPARNRVVVAYAGE